MHWQAWLNTQQKEKIKMKKTGIVLLCILCLVACNRNASKQESAEEKPRDRMSQDFTFESKADSVVSGEQIHYHKNGVIEMRGMMKDGKRDGLWKSWYENGLPWSETTFVLGKKNGKTTTWYDNGKKRYEGFYTNDKESGRWMFWKEDGSIADTKNYDLR